VLGESRGRASLDRCARRDPKVVGNPAQISPENLMAQSDTPPDGPLPTADPNTTSSFSLQCYYCEKLENVRQQLPEAARQLKEAGVVSVEIYYDGCGDSGQIESIHYFDAAYKAIDPTGQVTITDDALMDLFYDLLEARHAGWENNDGAFGQFVWDLVADTLKHSHSERYTECDTTEHEGL
jgi:uncharacterized protein DUF6878